jgi:hypothetical protein
MWITQTERNRGLVTRTPEMAEVLDKPDKHLPIEWTDNRTANVPEAVGEYLVEEYGGIEAKNSDSENIIGDN